MNKVKRLDSEPIMKALQLIPNQSASQAIETPPSRRRVFGSLGKLVFLTAWLAAMASAHATSVIDSLNDVKGATNGMSLATLNTTGIGGVGFTTKYEQTGSSVIVLRTNDLSVSLANYVSGQAASTQRWAVAATVDASGAARRAQTRSTPAMSGTIWFSFLASLLTPNGDVALVFNGGFNSGGSGSPASANSTPGMRVGLGSTNSTLRGALGVGPATVGSTSLNLVNITNGVNGAITAAAFVPTNGTPGLILGRIDTDPNNSLPRVSIWYNPDVSDAASLPTPTLSFTDPWGTNVPTSVTRIGYQVNRSPAPATQNEAIDNVKVSDEPNGFDIVYKNAALPTPVVSLVGTVLVGNESGPTNLVFTVLTDRPVATPLTVYYSTLTGVATNGYDGAGGFLNADYTDTNFNTGTLLSSVVIPQGQTNATVVLKVIDDALPEGDESVGFTLQTSTDYILGANFSATGTILDNNDANVSVQYMFTRTLVPQVWDTNMVAAPAVVAGIGGGTYSGTYYISPGTACSADGTTTAADAATAVANGDYMGILISPVAGRSLTLTNFDFQAVYGNYQYQVPGAASAVVFVRSSLDNFTTNVAEFVILPDNLVFPNSWYSNYVALGSEFSNLPGQVEFRLYIYDDSNASQVCVRIDNLYFNGSTAVLPPGYSLITVSTNVVNAAEPATPGQFTILRSGATTNEMTVSYTIGGTALNGVDYTLLPGTATFVTGQSNVVVTVTPIDDEIPEPTETVVLSLLSGTNYGVLAPSSATLNLADDGDLGIGGLSVYFFNENDNNAASLADIAAASIRLTNAVTALNATVGPGLGLFGRNNVAGVGHGYATTVLYSAPSTFYCRGDYLSTNATQALAEDDYLSLTIGPRSGYALTLTNFSIQVRLQGNAGQTNWVFLRSSADSFATDLGAAEIPGTSSAADSWLLWNVPLGFAGLSADVEFRLYSYTTRMSGSDILRLDDATFYGTVAVAAVTTQPHITGINVTGSNVEITFTAGASDSVSAFKLQGSGVVGSGYGDDNTATISTTGAGQFRASTSTSGMMRFYRIRR
jgi:hypothetical protein